LIKESTNFSASYTYLIIHPRYFIYHFSPTTLVYTLSTRLFTAISCLTVATMPGKRSRVDAPAIATTSKRLKVAPRHSGTASQPVPVGTQPSSPSAPPSPPPLSPRQAIVAASQAPNFEATFRESRAEDTFVPPTSKRPRGEKPLATFSADYPSLTTKLGPSPGEQPLVPLNRPNPRPTSVPTLLSVSPFHPIRGSARIAWDG
jgi:hypothetical protein